MQMQKQDSSISFISFSRHYLLQKTLPIQGKLYEYQFSQSSRKFVHLNYVQLYRVGVLCFFQISSKGLLTLLCIIVRKLWLNISTMKKLETKDQTNFIGKLLSETSVALEVFSKSFQVEIQTTFNFLRVGDQRVNIEVTVHIGGVVSKTDVCKSSITVGANSTIKLESATSLGKGSFSNILTFPFW